MCRMLFLSLLLLWIESSKRVSSQLSSKQVKYVLAMPQAISPNEEHFIFVQCDVPRFAVAMVALHPLTVLHPMGKATVIRRRGFLSFKIPFTNYKEETIGIRFTIYSCQAGTTDAECGSNPGQVLATNNTFLPILSNSLLLFADTSKPVYKPGEVLRFRLLTLYSNNLTPKTKTAAVIYDKITLSNAKGELVAQWKNVSWRTAFTGMSFQISNDPAFGDWRINAHVGQQSDEELISIRKYVLPRFVVETKPPPYLLGDASHVSFSVCARYSSGQPMKGKVNATFCVRPKTFAKYQRRRPCIKVNGILNGTKSCIDFRVSTASLKLLSSWYGHRYSKSYTYVSAHVKEKGTNAAVTKSSYGGVLSRTYYDIIVDAPSFYLPNFPFYGRVKTKHPDGTAFASATMLLEISLPGGWGYATNLTTDVNGVANFLIPSPPSAKGLQITFTSSVPVSEDDDARFARRLRTVLRVPRSMVKTRVYHLISPLASPSGYFMQLFPMYRLQSQQPCKTKRLRLRIQANFPLNANEFTVLATRAGSLMDLQTVRAKPVGTSECGSVDREDIGHYSCTSFDDGKKKVRCMKGWRGPNCLIPICPKGCSTQGLCLRPKECICKKGWIGEACETCVRKVGCENGFCYYGNDCMCYPGWYGTNCQLLGMRSWYGSNVLPRKTLPVKKKEIKWVEEDVANIFESDIELEVKDKLGPAATLTIFTSANDKMKNSIVSTFLDLPNLEDCFNERAPTAFNFEKKVASPGQTFRAFIRTSGTNVTCALAVRDIALENFQMSRGVTRADLMQKLRDIKEEMLKEQKLSPYTHLQKRVCSKDGVGDWLFPSLFDAQLSFHEAGLFVLSNAISGFATCSWNRPIYREKILMSIEYSLANPEMASGSSKKTPMRAPPPPPRKKTLSKASVEKIKKILKPRVRKFFPETWIFKKLVNPSSYINLTAPDSITTWKSNMYCISSKGVGIAPPQTLKVFQPFFIQIVMPYSLIRGETVLLPVKVFSYVAPCLEVILTASSSDRLDILGFARVHLCMCAFEHKTVNFTIRPRAIGRVPLKVSAVSEQSRRCPNPKGMNAEAVATMSDTVSRELFVEPEGLPEAINFGDILCPSSGGPTSMNLSLALPRMRVVPESVRAYLSWSGETFASALDNLDHLVKMPYGCGEQNMITLVPSIYVSNYLKNAGVENVELIQKAKKFINFGYKRQQRYRHKDGSYSAFGARGGAKGSTWLTAFVLRSFVEARKHVDISKLALVSAIKFLKSKQTSNGCFAEHGRVIHSTLKGGVTGDSDSHSMSAYVLTAFLEAKKDASLAAHVPQAIIDRGVSCLVSASPSTEDDWKLMSTYAIALRSYVLSQWNYNHELTNKLRARLNSRLKIKENFKYWPETPTTKPRATYMRPWQLHTAADVETTSYGILSFFGTHQSALFQTLAPLRWLANERNELGGWHSTQDTVVALQALASTASFLSGGSKGIRLQVTIDGLSGGSPKHSEVITNENRLLRRRKPISLPGQVLIKAKGSGCAVFQATLLFNVYQIGRPKSTFTLSATRTSSSRNCDSAKIRVCSAYKSSTTASNMAIIKAKMASGWSLSSATLVKLKTTFKEGGLQRVEVDRTGALFLYFDFLTSTQTCLTFEIERTFIVDYLKPMIIQVYDYYRPEEVEETSLNLHDKSCSSKIVTHDRDELTKTCPKCNLDKASTEAEIKRSCANDPQGLNLISGFQFTPDVWELTAIIDTYFGLWSARVITENAECKCTLPKRSIFVAKSRSVKKDGDDVHLDDAWIVLNADLLNFKTLTISQECKAALTKIGPR